MSLSIFVGLGPRGDITESALKEKIEESIQIAGELRMRGKCAFFDVSSKEDGDKVIDALNGVYIAESRLAVQWSQNKGDRGGDRGGRRDDRRGGYDRRDDYRRDDYRRDDYRRDDYRRDRDRDMDRERDRRDDRRRDDYRRDDRDHRRRDDRPPRREERPSRAEGAHKRSRSASPAEKPRARSDSRDSRN